VCFIIHIDSMCVHIMASPMQLTCAQVEAMCPSQRVSNVFIKVKGGRSRREQLILKLGAGRLCIRSDCSSIIVATSTTSPRYEHMTCPQCLGHNQNSPSRRRKTAAAAKPQAAGLAGFLIRYRRDHMETIRAEISVLCNTVRAHFNDDSNNLDVLQLYALAFSFCAG